MHYVLETIKTGRLSFRGTPKRTKYEADRYAETFTARGKSVKVHSFKNGALAVAFVHEHNARIDAEIKPAAAKPGLILNKAQAEAVYSAMCALNNVGAILSTSIRTDSGQFIEVHDGDDGICIRACEVHLPRSESYDSQFDFSAAYGLNADARPIAAELTDNDLACGA